MPSSYEEKFHHKPKQPLLNHFYKYFTEAERSGGDTSDKTLNNVLLHLSYPFFFFFYEVSELTQALLQNIRFF